MKHVDYKPQNGKLIRIDAELEGDVVKQVKITGDFFIYPEEAITEIENMMLNHKVSELEERLGKYVKERNIKLIGITISDLIHALGSEE